MKHKGFFASIMEAERLKGEQTFGLPPGTQLPVYSSEIFKEYPGNWMRGPGVFIVPVRANKGLWFNWTMNDTANTAVLPTVKGCNPITGLQTSGFHLERYETKCPKYDIDFGPDRFCEKCGYKWAPQNYCCSPNVLWWDGFRAEDGSVRQFFFTEEEVRDIASKMIGKENTVPAFGFAFYRPKVERPRRDTSLGSTLLYQYQKPYYHQMVPDSFVLGGSTIGGGGTKSASDVTWTYTNTSSSSKGLEIPQAANKKRMRSKGFSKTVQPDSFFLGESNSEMPTADGLLCAAPAAATPDEVSVNMMHTESQRLSQVVRSVAPPEKEVSVGAGAKISQDLAEDPYPLDSWKDKPDSDMTIYFVFAEEVDRMLKAGVVDTTDKKNGMLSDMPVG